MNDHTKKIYQIVEEEKLTIPLTVQDHVREEYVENYMSATQRSGRLFAFAGDQKIEHLNADFCHEQASQESAHPRHLFRIASKARIGVFATQLGLIARYGLDYPSIRYLVKMNSKTNLIATDQQDPRSYALWSVDQAMEIKQAGNLNIVGVGYTLYLGSLYEAEMMREAAQIFDKAHEYGLITVLWCYPRGQSVKNERDPNIIAGAAGVAVCLGADFVKLNAPDAEDSFESAKKLQQAVRAAGRTRVLCSGGPIRNDHKVLEDVYHQIHIGGARGTAVGRNILHKSENEAVAFCNAIAALVIDDAELEEAKKLLNVHSKNQDI